MYFVVALAFSIAESVCRIERRKSGEKKRKKERKTKKETKKTKKLGRPATHLQANGHNSIVTILTILTYLHVMKPAFWTR